MILIEKIPNDPDFYLDPPIAKPMPEGPIFISSEIVEVIDESIQININDYNDGDAYIITIYPPPHTPEISGPTSGRPNTEYYYKFVSENPSNFDLYYYIDWGDGTNSGWIGPWDSGIEITNSHSWITKGSYIIQAKVKNKYDFESDWGSLEVTMPRTKVVNGPILNFLDHYPILYQLLQRFLRI